MLPPRGHCCLCTRGRVGAVRGTMEPSAAGWARRTSHARQGCLGSCAAGGLISGAFLPGPGLLFLAFHPGLSAIACPKCGAPRASNYSSPSFWSRLHGSWVMGVVPVLGLPAGTLLLAVIVPQRVGAAQVD